MKKIELISLTIVILCLLSCVKADRKEIILEPFARIEYVDLNIMTPIHVECDRFIQTFKGDFKLKEISSNIFLEKLKDQLEAMELIDDNYNPSPDTRIKISIIDNSKFEQICIGNLVIRYKGESYKNNQGFRDFLESQLNK